METKVTQLCPQPPSLKCEQHILLCTCAARVLKIRGPRPLDADQGLITTMGKEL